MNNHCNCPECSPHLYKKSGLNGGVIAAIIIVGLIFIGLELGFVGLRDNQQRVEPVRMQSAQPRQLPTAPPLPEPSYINEAGSPVYDFRDNPVMPAESVQIELDTPLSGTGVLPVQTYTGELSNQDDGVITPSEFRDTFGWGPLPINSNCNVRAPLACPDAGE